MLSASIDRLRSVLGTTLVASAILLATNGCGGPDDQPEIAPVSGTVLYKGKPVAGAEVSFVPTGDDATRPSMARTDTDGSFTLNFNEEIQGAAVGTHNVLVTIYGSPEESKAAPTEPLPEGAEGPLPSGPPVEYRFDQRQVPSDGAIFKLELMEAS